MSLGYKQTDAGVIPDDWGVSTVGREFEIKLGKMLDAEKNFGVPKPYIGNRAVQWDRIDITDLPTVPMSRSDIERYRLRNGDLLVCEGGEVGRAAIWDEPIAECYYQKALHRLRPLRGFNSRVMAALLRQWSDRGLLTNYVTQTSIAHLPRDKFMEVPMPVPSGPEQRAIADALTDVDALLGALDRLIAKKRDLKQAATQQLLTGRTRLPGFHGEWEVKRFCEIGKLSKGKGLLKEDLKLSGSIPAIPYTALYTDYSEVVDYSLIKWFIDDESQSVIVSEPCLLLASSSNMEANTGKASALEGTMPVAIGREIIVFKTSSDCKFLSYLLGTPSYRRKTLTLARGTTIKHLYPATFQSYEVALPSLPEQTAIASVLSETDAELRVLEQRREKTRALKQAMMQELLTGRTRLV